MNRTVCFSVVTSLLALASSTVVLAQAPTPSKPVKIVVVDSVTDAVVLNRGPIHEAFAIPSTRNPVKAIATEKEPPPVIDEKPPAQQPAGDNIRWIPGYWALDEEQGDFVWISGLWREVPPGRTWVPGYWSTTGSRFIWVPGNWTDANAEQVTFLSEPPPSREIGPKTPSPGEGYFWVPGSWTISEKDYEWSPGYWAPHQRDWIWVPARYTYSPVGYIYTSGYWDYLLAYRGIAFAPVSFPSSRTGIVYTPTVAIDIWNYLTLHLFVGPSSGSYYFGDYYGSPYAEHGYLPFFQTVESETPDSLAAYYRWRFGNEYDTRLTGWHKYFNEHQAFRPKVTFRDELDFVAHHADDQTVATTMLVARLEDLIRLEQTPLVFADVPKEQRELYTTRLRTLQEFTTERVNVDRVYKLGDERPGFPVRASKFLDRPWEDEAVRLKPRTPDLPDQMKDIQPDDRTGRIVRVPRSVERLRRSPDDRSLPRYPTTPPAGTAILSD